METRKHIRDVWPIPTNEAERAEMRRRIEAEATELLSECQQARIKRNRSWYRIGIGR